jgi:hypothetical protein
VSEIVPTFHGELQLAGWSETHNGGCKVTFWLPDAAELEAFRALTVRKGNQAGQRFMAALVEVGDDEQPVQPEPTPEKPRGGPLAVLAGRLCQDPEFWRFATTQCGIALAAGQEANECAEWIRRACRVVSRAEIDSNPEATSAFHEIRGAWIEYRKMRGLS